MNVEPIELAWLTVSLFGLPLLAGATGWAWRVRRFQRRSGRDGIDGALARWRLFLFLLLTLGSLASVILVVPALFLPPRDVALTTDLQLQMAAVYVVVGLPAIFVMAATFPAIGILTLMNYLDLRRRLRQGEWR